MARIRMSHPIGETPPNFFADYEWIKTNRASLLEKYGEASIIVFGQRVIGVGKSYADAIADAEDASLDIEDEITPVHYHLTSKSFHIGYLRRRSERV